jgi:hypothetical protein
MMFCQLIIQSGFHLYLTYELETETAFSASFLDIYLKCDTNCQLSTRLYDKRGNSNFAIINFPHLDSNIVNINCPERCKN